MMLPSAALVGLFLPTVLLLYAAVLGYAERQTFLDDYRNAFAAANYVSAVWNVWLRTDYQGYDPDISLGGAAIGNRGIDWWVPPSARSWVVSVGLTR
jgi:hypothetical protein